MKNAWKKLAGEDTERDPEKQYTGETFDWILFEGCKAFDPAIDLAAKDICAKTKIAEILKYCVEAAKFFRKKTPELILSKAQVEQSGTSAILQLPVKTRWGTYSKLLFSIVASKDALKFAVCAPGILNDVTLQKEGERLRKMLWESDDFWLYVMDAQKILSPLAVAITSIEGNEVNSRWAYIKMREAFSKLKVAVETSSFLDEMKQEMMEILSNREEFAKSDVAYLLDVLEPSDRGQSLTNDEKQKAIVLLANKFMKNPVFATQKQAVLAEWASWLACTGIFAKENHKYAWDAVNTTDALTWWTAFFSDTLLSKIFQMLHNVPISAAPTERNWSLRGGIQTKLRNRMKVDTASQLTFIKQNLTLEYKDDFKKARVEQPMEEAEEQETGKTNIIEDEFDVFMDDF